MKIRFIIPGEPQSKARPRMKKFGEGRPYTLDKTRSYEELVRQCFLAAANGKRFADDAPVEIWITAFMQIPKSATKVRQAQMHSGRLQPLKKPDLDNVMKIVCDALNGTAYKDDAQITKATLAKCWSVHPEVWVTIEGEERKDHEPDLLPEGVPSAFGKLP